MNNSLEIFQIFALFNAYEILDSETGLNLVKISIVLSDYYKKSSISYDIFYGATFIFDFSENYHYVLLFTQRPLSPFFTLRFILFINLTTRTVHALLNGRKSKKGDSG